MFLPSCVPHPPTLRGNMVAFGDSVTRGGAPIAFAEHQKFVTQIATAKRLSYANLGVDGAGIAGQSRNQIYLTPILDGDYYFLLTGTNDMRYWDDDATGKASYQAALTAAIMWMSVPANRKTTAQSGGAYSNNWSNGLVYTGLMKYCRAVGKTATFSINGDTALVWTIVQNSAVGVGGFGVTIDGETKADINCAVGPTNSIDGMNYLPNVSIFADLGAGDHEIVLTSLDNNYAYLLGWAGFDAIPPTAPTIYIGNCLRMRASGYIGMGCAAEDVDYWNQTLIPNAVNAAIALGARVTLVDVSAALDPDGAGNMQADGIHPSAQGQTVIANTFLAAMV